MSNNYKDYRDQPDFNGVCALVYAICSADSDKISTYDEERELWVNNRWNINGNYITEFKCGKEVDGVSVQEALDTFGITPYVDPSEMRKEDFEG
jgi:hypothetical protein